jgi:hypothetical protein
LAPSDFHPFGPLKKPWWQTSRWWRRGETEVAETTVKRLRCCGFRPTGKAMRKGMNVDGGYVEK